jgi:cell division protein FtsI (penicillin-binding protein 3)
VKGLPLGGSGRTGRSKPSPVPSPASHRRRTRILAVVWALFGLVYVARAADLQIVQGSRWEKLAEAQNAEKVRIPAQRGALLDRDGRPLVLGSHEYRAYLAPAEAPDPRHAAAGIARALGLSRSDERRLASARAGWVAIPRRITTAERDRLQAAVHEGLHFEPLAARVYPEGTLARSLLGSVSSEGGGRSGLELVLDSLLRGSPGAALARRDARGRTYRIPNGEVMEPRPGDDVELTIDAQLQRIAEDALDRALKETGASGGDVVMADPSTGELLAVASRRVDDPLSVPAFTDPYEPGSTLKPFLLASLLTEGRVRLGEKVDTENGVWHEDGRTIRDVHGEDSLTVTDVIRFSSNIGAAKLSARLSPGMQYHFLRDFGFGVPTGVEYPAESSGLLRRPDDWSGFSQASLAMGYEISVTSLQLVMAYGALANGGVLMRPYLVKEVRSKDGEVVYHRDPEPVRRVIDPKVAKEVTRVLATVVESGTGSRARLATLPVAGKTGTARVAMREGYERGRYSASFVGYTPVDNPKLVVLTKLDDPQGSYFGGSTAAPLSRSMLQAALATRGVALPDSRLARSAPVPARPVWGGERRTPPPAEAGQPARGPFVFAVNGSPDPWPGDRDGQDGWRVLPDLRGLSVRSAVARLHELGLRVALRARGTVHAQSPGPGRRVSAGATVQLH